MVEWAAEVCGEGVRVSLLAAWLAARKRLRGGRVGCEGAGQVGQLFTLRVADAGEFGVDSRLDFVFSVLCAGRVGLVRVSLCPVGCRSEWVVLQGFVVGSREQTG